MTGFGKDGKGSIIYYNVNDGIGGVAVDTVVKSSAPALTEDYRILKAEVFACLTGITDGEEDAVLLFGFADSVLNTTEIKECIESTPLDSNDTALEHSHRTVFPIGILVPLADDQRRYLNGGSVSTWTQRWTFKSGNGFCWWIYNMGSAALTTGAVLSIIAKLYGVWVT